MLKLSLDIRACVEIPIFGTLFFGSDNKLKNHSENRKYFAIYKLQRAGYRRYKKTFIGIKQFIFSFKNHKAALRNSLVAIRKTRTILLVSKIQLKTVNESMVYVSYFYRHNNLSSNNKKWQTL